MSTFNTSKHAQRIANTAIQSAITQTVSFDIAQTVTTLKECQTVAQQFTLCREQSQEIAREMVMSHYHDTVNSCEDDALEALEQGIAAQFLARVRKSVNDQCRHGLVAAFNAGNSDFKIYIAKAGQGKPSVLQAMTAAEYAELKPQVAKVAKQPKGSSNGRATGKNDAPSLLDAGGHTVPVAESLAAMVDTLGGFEKALLALVSNPRQAQKAIKVLAAAYGSGTVLDAVKAQAGKVKAA